MSGASATPARSGPLYALLLALPALGFLGLAWALSQWPLPWRGAWHWVPSLDVTVAWHIDGLSAQMLALITGVGALVFLYGHGYLDHEPRRLRLYGLLSAFMLAMVGAVSADHVLLLFLFWEATSLLSFALVGWRHHREEARAAARQALLVTVGGGLALLGGLILLAQMAESWTLSGIVAAGPALAEHPRLPLALALVMLGAFTKSAQFPFHFWLPNAMHAPTPVSAYLHSATMVKLGVYLLARLDPAFNEVPFWQYALVGTGTVTAVWAAVLALRERDLKRILARTTVSALGTLVMLVGLPGPGAGLAVVAFLFAHALYKAPLFMVAGSIDHATGTRQIDQLMGLRRVMPWTAAVAVLAGLSMAGLPMSFGFVAKEAMSVAKAEAEVFALVGHASLLVNAVTVAVAAVAAVRVFWGPMRHPPGRVHEVSWAMRLPPLILALIALEFEFLPRVADPLLVEAATVVSPALSMAMLDAAYNFDGTLGALELTLAIGAVLFLVWDRLHDWLQRIHWLDQVGPEAAWQGAWHALPRLAAWQTRWLTSGRLGDALRLTLAALLGLGVLLAWGGTVTWRPAPGWLAWPAQGWAWALACALMLAGGVASLIRLPRIALLMASGLVGYGAALLFLFSGAPDLAFTQFAVETVLVVVAATVLGRLGPAAEGAVPWQASHVALALAAGLATFFLLAHLVGVPPAGDLPAWFAGHSLAEAGGRNVVNVIIVDFRAFDTLGEVAVLAASLFAALPLLAGLRRRPA